MNETEEKWWVVIWDSENGYDFIGRNGLFEDADDVEDFSSFEEAWEAFAAIKDDLVRDFVQVRFVSSRFNQGGGDAS